MRGRRDYQQLMTLMTSPQRKLVLAAAAALALASSARAVTTVSQPFQGVTWYQRTETTPRLVVMNIVEIDLTFPGISFTTTPSNGAAPYEVTASTTKNFVAASGAQIGINGDFYNPLSGADRDLIHLNMSNGQQVSPWSGSGSTREGALNISANNVASIIKPANVNNADYKVNPTSTSLYTAVGGNERLLSAGTVIATDTTIHPRTAVGVKGSKLYLFVVDGRQSGYSEGMNLVEIANLLKNDYGITDALNLDGGGSTSMVFADPTARTINRPSDGTDRTVANSFAVFAPLWPQWIKNGDGNYSTAANWAGGIPNGAGKQADFKNAITLPRTIALDVPVTMGTMNLVNPNAYTFAGPNALTFDATSGNAKINVTSGAHAINATTVLSDPLDVDVASGAGMTFANLSNPASKTFTKTGAGNLSIGAQTHGNNAVITINGGNATFSGALTVGTGSTLNVNTNLTISGTVNLPPNTQINVTGGTSSFNVNMGGTNHSAIVNVTGGGRLTFGATQRLANLNIGDNSSVTLGQLGNRIINTSNVSIAPTGKLDLVNNHMIVEYSAPNASPIGIFNGTEYTGITKFLARACNGGGWDGAGGILSTFVPNGEYAVGIAEASDLYGLTGSQTRAFGTETLDATTVILKSCLPGDANMDFRIDIDDYFRIDYGFANHLSAWAWGDFNYDGRVTGADYAIIDAQYAQVNGTAPAGLGSFRAAADAIPEPAGLLSLSFLAPALLARVRRR